jgi:hypothetical protein
MQRIGKNLLAYEMDCLSTKEKRAKGRSPEMK